MVVDDGWGGDGDEFKEVTWRWTAKVLFLISFDCAHDRTTSTSRSWVDGISGSTFHKTEKA